MAESARCSITGIMSVKILACMHRKNSDPALVGRALAARGIELDLCSPVFGDGVPDLNAYDALIIFGGPQSANDETPELLAEYRLIEKAFNSNKPLLGICLGAQMMARALGGQVGENDQGQVEVGFYPITANRDPQESPQESQGEDFFPPSLMAYQWHREGISLPRSAKVLAQGSEFFPVQAFWDGEMAYGLQFHPEVDFAMIRRWLWRDRQEDHRLRRPGARPYWSHLADYMIHHRAMRQWFNQFLDVWLKPYGEAR